MEEFPERLQFPSFEAVIFDLDGTLIDSEDRTEGVVRALLEAEGLDPGDGADLARFHGTTWADIGARIASSFPSLNRRTVAAELQAAFHAGLIKDPPPPIPGAREALVEALRHYPTAIVTSSNREDLIQVLTQFDLAGSGLVTVCAEDVRHSKPSPEGFLAAAGELGVPTGRCLVFEDSHAGLTAARAAGMIAIAIARDRVGDEQRALASIASLVIADFRSLPPDFFTRTASEPAR